MTNSVNAFSVEPLFATPVGNLKLREPTEKELDYIKSQDTRWNVGNKTSYNNYILNTQELSELKKDIEEGLVLYFQNVYQPQDGLSIKITQSWTNYSDGTQFHHKHFHPNSVLSGVYYPQSEHPDDKIVFHTPLKAYHNFRHYPKSFNLFNAEEWWLPAQTGSMLLFPSYLDHSVPAISDRKTNRISLSFNTFFEGCIGKRGDLNQLFFGRDSN